MNTSTEMRFAACQHDTQKCSLKASVTHATLKSHQIINLQCSSTVHVQALDRHLCLDLLVAGQVYKW